MKKIDSLQTQGKESLNKNTTEIIQFIKNFKPVLYLSEGLPVFRVIFYSIIGEEG